MEGTLVSVAAKIRHLGYGIGRVAQQRTGAVNPQRIDILTEIDMQLLGENMGQVDPADAQCMGGILQRERLGEMLRNVMQHLIGQTGMRIASTLGQRQARKQIGQKYVQISLFERG